MTTMMRRVLPLVCLITSRTPIRVKGFSSALAPSTTDPALPVLTPVQETSLLVAYWRHLEKQKENGLIQDEPSTYLIQALLSEERIRDFEESPICSCGQDILAVRTRCIDDWLLDRRCDLFSPPAGYSGRQLVNLGAGMCARYYRLQQELVERGYDHMWEIDSDIDLLRAKEGVLKAAFLEDPRSSIPLEYLEGDLAANSSFPSLEAGLEATSFQQSTKPTDWIVEGVLEYLHPNQHAAILEFAGSLSAPGSRVALQVLEEPLREYFASLGAGDLPWQELPPLTTFCDKACDNGWEVERIIGPQEWKKLYQRDISSRAQGFNMVFLKKP